MAPAVQGPDGEVDNEVPDYQNDSGGFFSHGDYTTTTALDVGINILQRMDFGWNASRGAYAFINVLDFEYFTFALSPSYYKASQLSRERSTSLEDGPKKFGARVSDKSVTAIGSLFFGKREAIGGSIYGGYGLHKIAVSIKDYRTGVSSSNEDIGTTILVGFGFDTKFGGFFFEEAWTTLPQRTGREPLARSFAITGNVLIGS